MSVTGAGKDRENSPMADKHPVVRVLRKSLYAYQHHPLLPKAGG